MSDQLGGANDRFAGMGAGAGQASGSGPIDVAQLVRRPAVLAVLAVALLFLGYLVLGPSSSGSSASSPSKAVPSVEERLKAAAQKLQKDGFSIEQLKVQLEAERELRRKAEADLKGAVEAEAARKATAAPERPADESTKYKAEISALQAQVAKVNDEAAKARSDLKACTVRVDTLALETTQLTGKLTELESVKKQLDETKAALAKESKKLDRDAMKLIDAGDKVTDTAAKQVMKDVKDDLIKQSVKMEATADKVEAVKDTVVAKAQATRDVVLQLGRDMAAPVGAPIDEAKKLLAVQARVEATSSLAPAPDTATTSAVASKEAVKKIEEGLVSTNEGDKIAAAEKLKEVVTAVKNQQQELKSKQQEVEARAIQAAVQEHQAQEHKKVAEKLEAAVASKEAVVEAKAQAVVQEEIKVEREAKTLVEERKELAARVSGMPVDESRATVADAQPKLNADDMAMAQIMAQKMAAADAGTKSMALPNDRTEANQATDAPVNVPLTADATTDVPQSPTDVPQTTDGPTNVPKSDADAPTASSKSTDALPAPAASTTSETPNSALLSVSDVSGPVASAEQPRRSSGLQLAPSDDAALAQAALMARAAKRSLLRPRSTDSLATRVAAEKDVARRSSEARF